MRKTGASGEAAGQSREHCCLRRSLLLQPLPCHFVFNPDDHFLRLLFLFGVLVFLIVIIAVKYLVPESLSEIKNIRPAVVVGIPGGG